jgi:hypothetical protein
MLYCNDADLLAWEPGLLKDATFASQTLIAGVADITGTSLTIAGSGPTFDTQVVEAGQVAVLTSGPLAGCYVITAVTSPTALELSVLYDDFFPTSGVAPPAVEVGSATGVPYVVRTFRPQRQLVSEMLERAVGLLGFDPCAPVATILNPQGLRRACALGTLQLIYSAVAAAADEPARYSVRADLYERLYRRALLRTQVDVDLDGDGRAEARRSPGLLRLVRE